MIYNNKIYTPKKYNKYKNQSCKDWEGNIKDSRLEAKHSNELFLREKAKQIIGLKAQHKIPFLNGMKHYYICDFIYYDLEIESLVLFDSKGFVNPVYKLKKDLILALYKDFVFIEKTYKETKEFYPYNKDFSIKLRINLALSDKITYTKGEVGKFNKILEELRCKECL